MAILPSGLGARNSDLGGISMTERIAEFDNFDDAYLFAKAKNREAGEETYTVCGGIHMLAAVRPKSRREVGLGDPFSPADSVVDEQEDCDDE